MQPELIVPAFDSIPLPAPVWMLKGLLLLTLSLHLLAMNMLVGSSLVALVSGIKSRKEGGGRHFELYREMIGYIPTLIAATVTLGVAPLLFVQVLYGHLVYTSSIAMGWFWWSVWALVIVAYYSFYRLKFKTTANSSAHVWLPWVGTLILIWISFILSNNFNLAQQPERFSKMILEDPSGWWLNLSDPGTFPRWLHMIIGAIAIGGIWLMWLGKKDYPKDPEYAALKLNIGYKMFAVPTMINIMVGFAYMMTLPREVMMKLMGQGIGETSMWMIGMGLAIWAIPTLKKATVEPQSKALLHGTIMMSITLAAMIILRDMVRSNYQKDFFHLGMPETAPMWGAIAMFFVTFVIGLGVFYWLVRAYYYPEK